jgi:micrococcal nuclease
MQAQRRRFRRRPSASMLLTLALIVFVVLRLWRAFSLPLPRTEPLLEEQPYQVQRIVDGDTIIVHSLDGSTEHRIRLLGMDTPETVRPGHAIEAWGPEATLFTQDFCKAGVVHFRLGRRRIDRYKRYLAWIYVDDQLLNAELVRAGLAKTTHYPGESSSLTRILKQAEEEARAAKRGIWSP